MNLQPLSPVEVGSRSRSGKAKKGPGKLGPKKLSVIELRLHIERTLRGHHTLDRGAVLELDEKGRRLLRLMALTPGLQDVPLRRNAVSALGLLGDGESCAVLVALACDREVDKVVVGRALLALSTTGSPVATYVIQSAAKPTRRPYVQQLAMWAAVHSEDEALGGVVLRALLEYPSNVIRKRAYKWLKSRGYDVDKPKPAERPKVQPELAEAERERLR